MWRRERKAAEPTPPADAPEGRLKDSVRKVRIALAERSSVVVDLRDAELARLELLNEALDPLFAEIPTEIELFDRGISQGDTPRLWIDVIAHVAMGRDKRHYQLVQDTRFGRKILADTHEIKGIVDAVTHYVASRLVERERALVDDAVPLSGKLLQDVRDIARRQRWRMLRAFLFGSVLGCAGLMAALWILALRLQH